MERRHAPPARRTGSPAGHAWMCLLLGALVLAGGCAGKPRILPQQAFWASMQALVGNAYPGRVVADSTDSSTFRGKPLLLAFEPTDSPDLLRMGLLVDGSPWATLELARATHNERTRPPQHQDLDRPNDQPTGLRLTHHHPAGEGMPQGGYGGQTRSGGTAEAQDFYPDAYTAQLEPGAADNLWTIQIRPGELLVYALTRQGTSRRLRMVFDLSRPQPLPTAADQAP